MVRDVQLGPQGGVGSNRQWWKGCTQANGTVGTKTGVEISELYTERLGPGWGMQGHKVGEKAEGEGWGQILEGWQSHDKAVHVLGSEDFTYN